MLSRKLICFIWNGWDSNKKMTSYIENKPLVPDTLVLARGNVLNRSDENVLNRSDENVLNRSDENVLKKRYVESLDELDRIALNVARSTLGSLFSLEKSNHYMEWKSAQRDRSANKNA
jgi:hypothetical protein